MKFFKEAEIYSIRYRENGETFYAVEVILDEFDTEKPIYLRTNKPVKGERPKSIGRKLLENAGYFVFSSQSVFDRRAPAWSDISSGTKQEAEDYLTRKWVCYDGTVPDIQAYDIDFCLA